MNSRLHKILLAGALLFGITSPAFSQGFGHFAVGPAIGRFDKLQRDLQQYQLLGPDFTIEGAGLNIGGGGFVIINSELLIGGSGFAAMYGNSQNTRGKVNLETGGGFFNLGYAIHKQDGWLLYPYGGFGYISTTLKLSNSSPDPFTLSATHMVRPGETVEYEAGGLALEGGFGLKKIIARDDHKSGFIIGLEFGTSGMPAMQGWEHDKNEVTGITSTRSQSYYLRFTFGGGFY